MGARCLENATKIDDAGGDIDTLQLEYVDVSGERKRSIHVIMIFHIQFRGSRSPDVANIGTLHERNKRWGVSVHDGRSIECNDASLIMASFSTCSRSVIRPRKNIDNRRIFGDRETTS